MSQTITGPLEVTLVMKVNPDNTVTVTKLNLTSNNDTHENIEAINTAVKDKIIKNNSESLTEPLLSNNNINDDNESSINSNNGTYKSPVINGGKRRRKTSKRSSGGKRKTSKYQKRKSGKYRQ